jgi:hypothetical protein
LPWSGVLGGIRGRGGGFLGVFAAGRVHDDVVGSWEGGPRLVIAADLPISESVPGTSLDEAGSVASPRGACVRLS